MILKVPLSIQIIYKTFTKKNEEFNISKKRKILLVFDDVIADMIHNEKLSAIVT